MNLVDLLIETERLRLLPTSEEFAEDIFKEFTDEVTTFMLPKTPTSIDDTLEFIRVSKEKMSKGVGLEVAIFKKDTGEFLGHGGIKEVNTDTPELGIWIKKGAHGNKYGREAVIGLKNWIDQNLKYRYIVYPVDRRNIPSRKIAESLGGVVEHEYKHTNQAGNILDTLEYRIYPR